MAENKWLRNKPQCGSPEPECSHRSGGTDRGRTIGSTNFGRHQCHAQARDSQDPRFLGRKRKRHRHRDTIYLQHRQVSSFEQVERRYHFCQFQPFSPGKQISSDPTVPGSRSGKGLQAPVPQRTKKAHRQRCLPNLFHRPQSGDGQEGEQDERRQRCQ